jgi:hypothetical protein
MKNLLKVLNKNKPTFGGKVMQVPHVETKSMGGAKCNLGGELCLDQQQAKIASCTEIHQNH